MSEYRDSDDIARVGALRLGIGFLGVDAMKADEPAVRAEEGQGVERASRLGAGLDDVEIHLARGRDPLGSSTDRAGDRSAYDPPKLSDHVPDVGVRARLGNPLGYPLVRVFHV